jgi:predicted dehydrogenase
MAIIGLGGFAGDHHRAARALEIAGDCRVLCACDAQPAAFQDVMAQLDLAGRGIPVYPDYLQMLERHRHELDLVTVPTPIPLHAPMHRAVLERDLACYLEKPPTLDNAELDEMLDIDSSARKQTQVGFNFIAEPERKAMKRRLLAGEFGRVKRVGFLGMAPRGTVYFGRSGWAGRLMMDGRLVLDSVMGNALAHYLHNLLFWAGEGEVLSWQRPATVRAEMYRAHAIENMDTLFARGVCENGVEVLVAATHACDGDQFLQEWIECDLARITHTAGQPYEIAWSDGRRETVTSAPGDLLQANFLYYFEYLRGEQPRPLTRLADARSFVEFYDLCYVAARRIQPVAEPHVTRSEGPAGRGGYVAIEGIRSACDAFLATGRFPSDQDLPWSSPGGMASSDDLGQLRSVVEAIAGS